MLNITISLKQSLPIDTTTSIYMVLSRGEHRVDSNNNRLDPKSIDEKCTDRIVLALIGFGLRQSSLDNALLC